MTTIWFVDTETGGLDSSRYSILSMAMVKWVDGEIKEKYDLGFIKEEFIRWTTKALEINKIKIEDVKKHGKHPTEICLIILDIIEQTKEDHVLGGHNISFDVGFIKRLFNLGYYKYPFSYRFIDTCVIGRFLAHCNFINTERFDLGGLCEYFDIEINNQHTSYGDVVATAELYTKMVKEFGE